MDETKPDPESDDKAEGAGASARRPDARPEPAQPAGEWVVGPYGDLISRAEFDAVMRKQADKRDVS
jgi:hypothetical protein